jgi:hypothetical protein
VFERLILAFGDREDDDPSPLAASAGPLLIMFILLGTDYLTR